MFDDSGWRLGRVAVVVARGYFFLASLAAGHSDAAETALLLSLLQLLLSAGTKMGSQEVDTEPITKIARLPIRCLSLAGPTKRNRRARPDPEDVFASLRSPA